MFMRCIKGSGDLSVLFAILEFTDVFESCINSTADSQNTKAISPSIGIVTARTLRQSKTLPRTTREHSKHYQNWNQSFHEEKNSRNYLKWERSTSQFECEVFSGNFSITSTLKISTNFTTVKLTETHRKVGFCV